MTRKSGPHGGIHDHAGDKVANRALGSLTSTHSAWRGKSLLQSGAGFSQTTRRRRKGVRRFSEAEPTARRVVCRFAGEVLAQHVKERAVMNAWVSTWTAKSLT